jgi:hypothetical protein
MTMLNRVRGDASRANEAAIRSGFGSTVVEGRYSRSALFVDLEEVWEVLCGPEVIPRAGC